MQLQISLSPLFIIAVLLPFASGPVLAQAPEVAAWIESTNPKDALLTSKDAQFKAKIVVLRQGKSLPASMLPVMTELKSGDRILINDDHAYLNLLTSTGRLRVTADMARKDGYEIKASPNSVWRNLVALVTDKIKPGQTQVLSASSRGGDAPPTIPAGHEEAPKLAAGERALHILWKDGEPPYRLSLVRADKVLSEINVSNGFAATLPKQSLPPGNYELVLKDKKGLEKASLRDGAWLEHLILVVPTDVPPMPSALANSMLPEEARQLLYADWLVRQGTGEWCLEAIQKVFPYAGDYEPAADWLRQWGGQ